MSRRAGNVILALAIVVVLGVAFFVGGRQVGQEEEPFAGSDVQATTLVESAHPAYEAWFQPFFSPGSSEIESGLFAVQAGLGGIAIGYVAGRLRERRRRSAAALEAGSADTATT